MANARASHSNTNPEDTGRWFMGVQDGSNWIRKLDPLNLALRPPQGPCGSTILRPAIWEGATSRDQNGSTSGYRDARILKGSARSFELLPNKSCRYGRVCR